METGGWEFPSVFIFDFFEDGQGGFGWRAQAHPWGSDTGTNPFERICLDPKGAGQDSLE